MEGREEKGQESKNGEEGKWKGVNRRKGNWKDRAISHFSAAIVSECLTAHRHKIGYLVSL